MHTTAWMPVLTNTLTHAHINLSHTYQSDLSKTKSSICSAQLVIHNIFPPISEASRQTAFIHSLLHEVRKQLRPPCSCKCLHSRYEIPNPLGAMFARKTSYLPKRKKAQIDVRGEFLHLVSWMPHDTHILRAHSFIQDVYIPPHMVWSLSLVWPSLHTAVN